MKFNKKEILIEKAKQVLEDIERHNYLEDSFMVFLVEENREKRKYSISKGEEIDFCSVLIQAPDEQFIDGFGIIVIDFKYSNLEPYKYHDGAAEGPSPDFKVSKKDNKYFLDGVYEDKLL